MCSRKRNRCVLIGISCIFQVWSMPSAAAARYTQIVFEGTEVIPVGSRGGRQQFPISDQAPNAPVPEHDLSFPFRRVFTIDREAKCIYIQEKTRLWRGDLSELEPQSEQLSYHDGEHSVGLWEGELFARPTINDAWGSAIFNYLCSVEITQQNIASVCEQFPRDVAGEKVEAGTWIDKRRDNIRQVIGSSRDVDARAITAFAQGQNGTTCIFSLLIDCEGNPQAIAFRGVFMAGKMPYTLRTGRIELKHIDEVPKEYLQLKESAKRFEAPPPNRPPEVGQSPNSSFSPWIASLSLAVLVVSLFVAARHEKGRQ